MAHSKERGRTTGAKRWYLCECANDWCEDEFFMSVIEYRAIVLSNARVVLPRHKELKEVVRAVQDGVLIIEGGV